MDEQLQCRSKVATQLRQGVERLNMIIRRKEELVAAADRAHTGYVAWLDMLVTKKNGEMVGRRQNDMDFRRACAYEVEIYQVPRRLLTAAIRNAQSDSERGDSLAALQLFDADPKNAGLLWPAWKQESYDRVVKNLDRETELATNASAAKATLAHHVAEAVGLSLRSDGAAARVQSTKEEMFGPQKIADFWFSCLVRTRSDSNISYRVYLGVCVCECCVMS